LLLMPEVWYIDNQSELKSSSSAERAFTHHTGIYYNAEDIIYRHIVLSKPTLNLENPFLGPGFTARVALWWSRRGARYIPVANSVSALLGYLNFFYRGKKVDYTLLYNISERY